MKSNLQIDRKQRFPAWQVTVLAVSCIVAVVGVINQLDPWVICQRMLFASLLAGIVSALATSWFATVFREYK